MFSLVFSCGVLFRVKLCVALLCVALAQIVTAPYLTQVSDTGSGTARLSWIPSVGAADYLVSAEPYLFTENLPGNSLTPGGK